MIAVTRTVVYCDFLSGVDRRNGTELETGESRVRSTRVIQKLQFSREFIPPRLSRFRFVWNDVHSVVANFPPLVVRDQLACHDVPRRKDAGSMKPALSGLDLGTPTPPQRHP